MKVNELRRQFNVQYSQEIVVPVPIDLPTSTVSANTTVPTSREPTATSLEPEKTANIIVWILADSIIAIVLISGGIMISRIPIMRIK